MRDSENSSVVFGIGVVLGQEEMPPFSASCFGFGEVGGVAVCGKDHVAYTEVNGGVQMGCRTIQQLVDFLHGVLCGC